MRQLRLSADHSPTRRSPLTKIAKRSAALPPLHPQSLLDRVRFALFRDHLESDLLQVSGVVASGDQNTAAHHPGKPPSTWQPVPNST